MRERALSILLLSPAIVATLLFVYVFIGWTVYASMTAWSQIRGLKNFLPDFPFVGLDNYVSLFKTGRFWPNDVQNTIVFTVGFIGLSVAIGLLLAILVDQRIRGESFFRNIFLLPMALSFVVTGTIWAWVFNPRTGINQLLAPIGVDSLRGFLLDLPFLQPLWGLLDALHVDIVRPGLTADPRAALGAVIIAATWQMSGFVMAMLLAGLRGISEDVREAARVDGASELQVYRYILIPMLRPVFVSVIVLLDLHQPEDLRSRVRHDAWGSRARDRLPVDLHVRQRIRQQPVRARRGDRRRHADRVRGDRRPVPAVADAPRGRVVSTTERAGPRERALTARRGIRASRVALYAVLLLFTVFYLLPVYVVLVGSLKTLFEVNTTSIWQPPSTFSLKAFQDALQPPLLNSGGIASGLRNSLLLTIPAVVLSSLWGSLNGYLLSKWRFRGSDTLFTLLLFGMFIPYQAILIPLVNLLQQVHLYDSLVGLGITHIIYGIPITTLIFRNYYASIPSDLVEAARVDGAGLAGVYLRVILPLSVPGFVVVGIWQFTNIWNEFLFAVTITNSPGSQPVTVSLQNLAGSFAALYNVQMAGALLSAIPTILVFALLSRYFIRGLLAGSLKG